jgi:alginate O-acetyltransferase complex protein AlgI
MLFNSIEYIIFFPVVYLLYWYLFSRDLKVQNLLLLFSGYVFYGWWSYKFLFILFASTLLDFLYGFGVSSSSKGRSKFFLWLSILNNLGLLALFKYYDFFVSEIQTGLKIIGIETNPVLLNLVLPVGISFYTFHGMSYIFDIYRGVQKPINNFIEYAVFVCFFPLLVAGPIERANHLLPQIQNKRLFNYKQSVEGCRLILWGFFKKVVIADSLAGTANLIFENYNDYNDATLIIGILAFSFQIYGDFSGYTDIALGSAKLLGFELLSNFRFPYFSRNIAEFWRRWHISLSSWFRDYLYIPLGGSRGGKQIAVINTFIIFIVSGFWHGASWNFIVWGLIHAIGFIPLLLLDDNRKYLNEVVAEKNNIPSIKELFEILCTFSFVSLAWVFFRSESVGKAVDYLLKLKNNIFYNYDSFFSNPAGKSSLIYICVLILFDWKIRRNERVLEIHKNVYVRYMIYILLFTLVLVHANFFKKGSNIEFIYFQF